MLSLSNLKRKQKPSLKSVSEPEKCIRFFAKVSYVIESVCFGEISVIYSTYQVFILFLSTFGLTKKRSNFLFQRIQIFFVTDFFLGLDFHFLHIVIEV